MSTRGPLAGVARTVRSLRRGGRPRLSVVVPVYNVVDFLGAALDSILRQPYSDFEVVVVDDGSTDESGELADDYARLHRSIRVVHQANAGVSVARNNAITHCRGEFLTFVDPDDELPADAWTAMMRTLDTTGSDFVVGSAQRVRGGRRVPMPLMQRNHGKRRLRITIEDQPMMLADVFVWNKIFRRDFWDRHRIWFPEHTRYQDQVALTQAFLASTSFDVLTEVVYEWRMRADLSSATQRRAEMSNLHERVRTKQMAFDMVREHGSPEVMQVLLTEILPIDMWEHFRAAVQVPGEGPDSYWAVLRDAVRAFWNDSTLPFEDTHVAVQQRLMGWFVAHDRRDDLVRLIEFIDTTAGGLPIEDGRLLHPWHDEPGLPERLVAVGR